MVALCVVVLYLFGKQTQHRHPLCIKKKLGIDLNGRVSVVLLEIVEKWMDGTLQHADVGDGDGDDRTEISSHMCIFNNRTW